MDPRTGEIIRGEELERMSPEERARFEPVPEHLSEQASALLAYRDLRRREILAEQAEKRKHERRRAARISKASRRRNR